MHAWCTEFLASVTARLGRDDEACKANEAKAVKRREHRFLNETQILKTANAANTEAKN